MTGNPELLDGTAYLVPSISLYLGNKEKLIVTRIGSFKSPKVSILVLVVPGQNVNLISCPQLCAITSTKKEYTRCGPSKLLKPFHPGARTAIKVPIPFTLFLDFMEILMTSTSVLKRKSKPPSFQEGHPMLNDFRAIPLRCHGSFHQGLLKRKTLPPSHRQDVKIGFPRNTEVPI